MGQTININRQSKILAKIMQIPFTKENIVKFGINVIPRDLIVSQIKFDERTDLSDHEDITMPLPENYPMHLKQVFWNTDTLLWLLEKQEIIKHFSKVQDDWIFLDRLAKCLAETVKAIKEILHQFKDNENEMFNNETEIELVNKVLLEWGIDETKCQICQTLSE